MSTADDPTRDPQEPFVPGFPLEPNDPTALGRYQTQRRLGSGTFGNVYYAYDPVMMRSVAIKVPRDAANTDFLAEARRVASLHHPNICPVYDVGAGTQNDPPFIVMRYAPGGTLMGLVRDRLAPATALGYARQIANGLTALHTVSVIHRDLKPANVLVDPSAYAPEHRLLLSDFGIARQLGADETDRVIGTPRYMAPEQWERNGRFGSLCPQTDVYALGVILFELLTGEPLFPPGERANLHHAHCHTPPRAPSGVCPDLGPFDELCLRALAKQPADRHQSAHDFATAIGTAIRETGGSDSPPEPPAHAPAPLNVPGEWSEREIGTEPWVPIAAPVTGLQSGYDYRLRIDRDATDDDLATLRGLGNPSLLREIYAGRCAKLTDGALAPFSRLNGLRSLNLYHCGRVGVTGLAHLRGLNELEELVLDRFMAWSTSPRFASGCAPITDTGLVHLATLKNLRQLDLGGCHGFTGEGLRHLSELAHLTTLDLSGDSQAEQLTDAGLQHLPAFPNLRALKLGRRPALTDTGAEYLGRCATLRHLDLRNCPLLTDGALAHIGRLSELESLALRWCDRITDAGVRSLLSLRRLHSLDLSGCIRVTRDGLMALSALPDLQSLRLDESRTAPWALVAKGELQTLRAALPACSVFRMTLE